MKNLLYLITIFVVYTSCVNIDNNNEYPKDKFIGLYIGTGTIDYYLNDDKYDSETSTAKLLITSGNLLHEIIIDNEIIAIVDDNSFTIKDDQFIYNDIGEGTSIKFEVSGYGYIGSNGSIILDVVYTGYYNKQSIVIKSTGVFIPE